MSVIDRARGFVDGLNAREKALLLIMVSLFTLFFLIIVFMNLSKGTGESQARITEYAGVLSALRAQQEGIVDRLRRADELEQRLDNNRLQLGTFIAQLCEDNDVPAPASLDPNVIPQRDPETGVARIEEIELVATIDAVDPDRLAGLVRDIALSEELVLLKSLRVQPARRSANRWTVRLTLSTYRRIANFRDES